MYTTCKSGHRVVISEGYEKEGAGLAEGGGRGGGDIYESQRVYAELHVINCDLASAAAHHLVSTIPRVRIIVSKSPFFI